MPRTEARILTDRSVQYMRQLCTHFAPKAPTIQTRRHGQITFSSGTCRLEATDSALAMVIEADDAQTVARLESLLARRLEWFAFLDRPTVMGAGLEPLKF